MRLTEKWEDQTQEDYFIYLSDLDPDVCPMEYESFAWLRMRESQEEYAEALME